MGERLTEQMKQLMKAHNESKNKLERLVIEYEMTRIRKEKQKA